MQHRWKHTRRAVRSRSLVRHLTLPYFSSSFLFSSLFLLLLSPSPLFSALNLASPLSLLTLTRAFNNRGYVFVKRTEKSHRGFNAGKARQKQKEKRERGEKVYTPVPETRHVAIPRVARLKRERTEKRNERWKKKKAERKTGIEKEKKGREGAEREREREWCRLWAARRKVLKASAFIRQTPPRSASFHHFLLPLPFTVSCTVYNHPRNRATLGNYHGTVAITGTAILFVHAR